MGYEPAIEINMANIKPLLLAATSVCHAILIGHIRVILNLNV